MVKLDKEAVALFKGKNFAYIATVNRDGSPQVSPVWVDIDGEQIIVNTAVGRVKERNVSRDKRVGLAIHDSSNPYSRRIVKGKVVKEVTGKKADESIDALSFKYTGNKKYQGRTPGEKRVVWFIQPVSVTS